MVVVTVMVVVMVTDQSGGVGVGILPFNQIIFLFQVGKADVFLSCSFSLLTSPLLRLGKQQNLYSIPSLPTTHYITTS